MRRDALMYLLAAQPTHAVIHRAWASLFALLWIALRLSTLLRRYDANLWVKGKASANPQLTVELGERYS